ncbi:MAG: four helix bundle protein [Bacteroidota bacterium]
MIEIKSHTDLELWKQSIELVKETYLLTKSFPADERFGLTQQMRRSSVSISSNIAEGAGRGSKKAFICFLNISKGSLSELETQFIIARELQYTETVEIYLKRIRRLKALIKGLINMLKK